MDEKELQEKVEAVETPVSEEPSVDEQKGD